MTVLSKTLGFVLAVAAVSTAFAAAASLGLGSQGLSAGDAPGTSGGVTSLGATRTGATSRNVTKVTVGGIPGACAGETLSLTLVASGGGALASASTTVAGTTATFTGLGSVPAASLSGYQFAVTGA
jgi:uncharacterized Zn-binding protein involved in type VI secretion